MHAGRQLPWLSRGLPREPRFKRLLSCCEPPEYLHACTGPFSLDRLPTHGCSMSSLTGLIATRSGCQVMQCAR